MSAFDLRDLTVPIIVAPMAGGPSTPELAAAGTNAGGLGFVPAGYLTAEVFAERVTKARQLATGPIGANLFAPQPSAGTPAAIEAYAAALAPEAERYGAALGSPRFDDDAWAAKLDVLLDLRPEVASFTFGVPSDGRMQKAARCGHRDRRHRDDAGGGAGGRRGGRRCAGGTGPFGGRTSRDIRPVGAAGIRTARATIGRAEGGSRYSGDRGGRAVHRRRTSGA